MKIAFIVGGFPKISETFILNQITGLVDLGHDVRVFANRRPAESVAHPDVERYGLVARTHHFDLPDTRGGRLARAAVSLLRLLPRHPRAALRCCDLSADGSFYAVLNNLMRAEVFLRWRPDAVMCHYGTNGIGFIFLKDLLPHLRFATMFHAGDIRLIDEEGPQVYARLRERGDVFLAISDSYNRRRLIEAGFDPARIVTHRIGVAVGAIPFRPRRLREGGIRVLTVARLDPEKGIEHALAAVAALRDRRPDLRIDYRIAGDGALRARLEALVEELRLGDRVQLLGWLPTPRTLEEMADADLFLLPSLAEATPTVLLEAQASGLPILATDVGAVAEIVQQGEPRAIVEPGDAPALAAAFEYLVDHDERWESMARAGRAYVEREHDIHLLDQRLSEILAGGADGGAT